MRGILWDDPIFWLVALSSEWLKKKPLNLWLRHEKIGARAEGYFAQGLIHSINRQYTHIFFTFNLRSNWHCTTHTHTHFVCRVFSQIEYLLNRTVTISEKNISSLKNVNGNNETLEKNWEILKNYWKKLFWRTAHFFMFHFWRHTSTQFKSWFHRYWCDHHLKKIDEKRITKHTFRSFGWNKFGALMILAPKNRLHSINLNVMK